MSSDTAGDDDVGPMEDAARKLVAACERLRLEQRVQERADIAARVAIEDIAGAEWVGDERNRRLNSDAVETATRWAMKKRDDVREARRGVQRAWVHMSNVLRAERLL